MKINPIRDKILVEPAEVEKTTKGGLVIPDNVSEGPDRGTVVSVGSGKLTEQGTVVNLEISQGDTVLYPRGAGVKTKINDTEYLILTEEYILATVAE